MEKSKVKTNGVNPPFEIAGQVIAAGSRVTINLPVGLFSNHMPATMPVRILHGRKPGPVVFVSAAVHGDEIIGVEIIRRLLRARAIRQLKGTLICIPVVNTYGFVSRQRYLPDRRDLNRCFPGSAEGSLAGQLAHLFVTEILSRSDFGIDLHSAAIHRVNLPQIRFSGDHQDIINAAAAFAAPVILQAPLREGSLRKTAQEHGVDVLLYESGEALRFDEYAVRVGMKGILNVLKYKGIIDGDLLKASKNNHVYATSSRWLRSPRGGIFRATRTIGNSVHVGEVLGYISDPFGDANEVVASTENGIIIGRTNLPIVNPGDALFHIAQVKHFEAAGNEVEAIEQAIISDPLFDEDEII